MTQHDFKEKLHEVVSDSKLSDGQEIIQRIRKYIDARKAEGDSIKNLFSKYKMRAKVVAAASIIDSLQNGRKLTEEQKTGACADGRLGKIVKDVIAAEKTSDLSNSQNKL